MPKLRGMSVAADIETAGPASAASIVRGILRFGLLGTAFSFAAMLVFPDLSWVSINLLLQFQPTKVFGYALMFGLGIYAHHRQWFANPSFFNHPGPWALTSVFLAVIYLFCAREVFSHPYDSQTLAPALLLSFAAARSFLCLAVLVMLLSFAHRYVNRPITINRTLTENSFNIYLVHFFFVIFLQELLMLWSGGPALGKIGIVFIITLPASYGVSRLIDRFPRGFVLLLIGLFILGGIAMR
ncbi:MAG: acyltransferase family protein [Firmicutes bacterium]|nr:acyltransferase family protein [Bacillota bacterium]